MKKWHQIIVLTFFLLVNHEKSYSQIIQTQEIYEKSFELFCDSVRVSSAPCDRIRQIGKKTLGDAIILAAKRASADMIKQLKRERPRIDAINDMGRGFSIFGVFYKTPMLKRSKRECEIIFISDELFFAFKATFRGYGYINCGDSSIQTSYSFIKFKRIQLSQLETSIEWLMFSHLYNPNKIDRKIFRTQVASEIYPEIFHLKGVYRNGMAFQVVGLEKLDFYKSSVLFVPKLQEPD